MSIDLTSLVGKNILVLAGVERGMAAREEYGLDALDDGDDAIVVIGPDNLEAISPSFVQGFFSKSFAKLGENGLRKKYEFKLNELLVEDILDGLKRLKMQRSIAGH